MIGMFGDNFIDVLRNLDEMHGHISVTTPDLRPPQFSCEDAGDGRYPCITPRSVTASAPWWSAC